MRILPIILVVMISSVSCRKDRLKDDKAILIGKWNWIYSKYDYNKCQQCCVLTDTLNPATENDNYSMAFEHKGKIKFYENGILTKENRIVFDNFYQSNEFVFDIHLNNNEDDRLLGRVWGDSLYTWDYPFKAENSPCDDYKNYFVKE